MNIRYPAAKIILAALPLVVLLFLIARGYSAAEAEQKTPPKPALAVTMVSPRVQPWSERITASGNIQPWQAVSIGPALSGLRLTKVTVSVGDTVHKGQVLACLDDEGTLVDLRLQLAALVEAEANLAQAELSVERARKLDASRAISRQDLLQYETAAKIGAAKLEVAKAQVDALRLRLRHTRIVAPDDGVISSSTASVGALSDSTSELFKLIRQGRVEWRAELRPEQQANVQPGQEVELHDPLGHAVPGRVRQIAPTADIQSRISLVYVDVQPNRVLKPGVLATGDFLVSNRMATTVPQSALVWRDGYGYAMRVDAEGYVKSVKVTVGEHRDDYVEVLEGLRLEDRIVSTGGAFLQDGDRVTIIHEVVSPIMPVADAGGGQQ